MAKRKLSESQRLSVRKDLKRALASGASNAEALRKVGAKYKINPESVRWYLKELKGDNRKTGIKRRTRARTGSRKAGISSALLREARAAAQDKARKATTLMRLVPDYRKIQKSEVGLRERLEAVRATERSLARDLKKTTRDRRAMENKLKELI